MSSPDIQRTIEFILKSQARSEARQDAFDRRLEAIRKIIQQGMRLVVKIEASHERSSARLDKTEAMIAELTQSHKHAQTETAELKQSLRRTEALVADLAQSQEATQRSLKAFLDSMRHGRNGA